MFKLKVLECYRLERPKEIVFREDMDYYNKQ